MGRSITTRINGKLVFIVLAPLVPGECSQTVSGVVRDASTDRPIPDATLEVVSNGWGLRGGRPVWDNEIVSRTRTDSTGRFVVRGGGGNRLTIAAIGYRPVIASLCSKQPMVLRMGGLFDGSELESQLRMGVDGVGSQVGADFASGEAVAGEKADLNLVTAPPWRDGTVILRAAGGLSFVSGSGNPPVPPLTGYAPQIKLDLFDCGWLFVRSRGAVLAVIRTGSFGTEEAGAGAQYLTLSYRTERVNGR